ncbi:MAG: hypothetical protein OQK82_08480 [Candidatus Pacearchaeota archaeon]|nr:hypothetical protein [Candidatus Pacearchaeota archaeon]
MLCSRLIEAGFSLKSEGGNLLVEPASRLTDEQRAFIREHKPQLVAELSNFDKVNAWLDHIGEDDPQCRAEVLETWRDPEGLEYFLARYSADIEKDTKAIRNLWLN